MPNRPLTDQEWAAIKRQIARLAEKHNLDGKVYPPKPKPVSPVQKAVESWQKKSA